MLARDIALRTRTWLPLEPPIDVEIFVAGLGALHHESALIPGLYGLTLRRKQLWIVTRRGLTDAERRLAVLHEGGHILMHAGNCLYIAESDARWADKNEHAADAFAAEYGIPDALVAGCRDEHELAADSGLPVELCRLRLRLAAPSGGVQAEGDGLGAAG